MLLGRKYGKLERYRKNATCLVRPACIPGNGAGKDSEQNILTFPVMTVDFPWTWPDFLENEQVSRQRKISGWQCVASDADRACECS